MPNILKTLRQLLLAFLFLPLWASAGYLSIGNIGIAQVPGTPIITDLGNGTSLWRTDITWTNNNAFTTNPLYFVNTAMWINGAPVDANAMTWNDALGRFEKGNFTGTADNEAFYVELSDTDLSPNPVFGTNANDALAAFAIGFLNAGQSVTTQVNFVMTNGVGPLWFSGAIVQQVPVPATLALAGLALVMLPVARRRTQLAVQA